jgi:hypothetical protein
VEVAGRAAAITLYAYTTLASITRLKAVTAAEIRLKLRLMFFSS